jgi:hypothetical protein
MISENLQNRKCSVCKELKNSKAFIGLRDQCRLCWYYLTDEEKQIELQGVKKLNASAHQKKLYKDNPRGPRVKKLIS